MRHTPDDRTWQDQFTQERDRLLAALGTLPDGGIVERAEHVGATSVPGLLGQPILDMTLSVWPFPLADGALHTLATLGYAPDPNTANTAGQAFTSTSGATRILVTEAGSARITDDALLRDYLRSDEAARDALSARKRPWAEAPDSPGYAEAKREAFADLLPRAHAFWIAREGFGPVSRVAEELRDFDRPWSIAGGWSLDLFLGRVARVHEDVDVIIARDDQFALREYLLAREWKLVTPFDGRLEPWPEAMRLELPRFQVHAHRDGAFLDFLLADLEGGVWRFRRNPLVVRDASRMTPRTPEGISYLAPEVVLLYKSRTSSGEARDKDKGDFEKAYAHMDPEQRAWLRWALVVAYPDHPWIARL